MYALLFSFLLGGSLHAETCDEGCWLERVRVRDEARVAGAAKVCRHIRDGDDVDGIATEITETFPTLYIDSITSSEPGAICFSLRPR